MARVLQTRLPSGGGWDSLRRGLGRMVRSVASEHEKASRERKRKDENFEFYCFSRYCTPRLSPFSPFIPLSSRTPLWSHSRLGGRIDVGLSHPYLPTYPTFLSRAWNWSLFLVHVLVRLTKFRKLSRKSKKSR